MIGRRRGFRARDYPSRASSLSAVVSAWNSGRQASSAKVSLSLKQAAMRPDRPLIFYNLFPRALSIFSSRKERSRCEKQL